MPAIVGGGPLLAAAAVVLLGSPLLATAFSRPEYYFQRSYDPVHPALYPECPPDTPPAPAYAFSAGSQPSAGASQLSPYASPGVNSKSNLFCTWHM